MSTADDSWIDEEHLKLYPYCGKMTTKNPSGATTRVANSEASKESYRWAVRVTKKTLQNTKPIASMFESLCSGTIITER